MRGKKERYELDVLYELYSIRYVKLEIDKFKAIRTNILKELNPSRDVGAVDYSKWKVDGNGNQTPIQETMKRLLETNQNIIALEELLNILEETTEKKKECIMSTLTEREKLIFQKSFIENMTSEDISFEYGIGVRTISRDRKEVIRKISTMKSIIENISNEKK